jgi:hypothetical protein
VADLDDLADKLQRLRRKLGADGLAREIAPELVVVALEGEATAKRSATGNPAVRSDRLRGSIQGLYDAERGSLILRAGGRNRGRSVLYARIQDRGGTVSPRRTKYLAIPLRAAKTAAGVPRFASARNDPTPMHVRPGRQPGTLLLHDNRTGMPRYFLTRGPVRIPPTRFMSRAADQMARDVPQALDRAFRRLLRTG